MEAVGVIGQEGAEHGVEYGRSRHARDLAQPVRRDAERDIPHGPNASTSAPAHGVEGRALTSAVRLAGFERGPRPQEGAAYG
jgi:hypothetical protein